MAQHTEDLWYGREGKCGGSAVEQRVITWGDLSFPASVNSGSVRSRKEWQKSADAIVVEETSRSARLHSKVAGGLTRRRAEPIGSVLTAWRTVVTAKASRLGDTESLHDGKHVNAQDEASASFSREPLVRV